MIVGKIKYGEGGPGAAAYDNVILYTQVSSLNWISYLLIPMDLTEEEKLMFSVKFGFSKFLTIDEFRDEYKRAHNAKISDLMWFESRIKTVLEDLSRPEPLVFSPILIGKENV